MDTTRRMTGPGYEEGDDPVTNPRDWPLAPESRLIWGDALCRHWPAGGDPVRHRNPAIGRNGRIEDGAHQPRDITTEGTQRWLVECFEAGRWRHALRAAMAEVGRYNVAFGPCVWCVRASIPMWPE